MKISKTTKSTMNMYQASGWEFDREDDTVVVMTKKNTQSVGVHILLFLFTCGVGNIVYWLVKRKPLEKKIPKE